VVTGVLVQSVLLLFVMAALLILAQAANIHSATTLQGTPVKQPKSLGLAQCFGSGSAWIRIKMATLDMDPDPH